MSLSAAAIRLMAEKGLSASDIADVAEANEPSRSSAAIRAARYRERGGDKIPVALRELIFERDNSTCQDCGATDDLCIDHIVPVSKGGETDEGNLQVLCRPCNGRKRDRVRKRDVRRMSARVRMTKMDTDGQNRTPNDIYSNPTDPCGAKAPQSPSLSDRVVDDWNSKAAQRGARRANPLNASRRKHLAARVKEHGEEAIFRAIGGIASSDWHCGRVSDWRADIGWLLKSPENFQKALELADSPPRSATSEPSSFARHILDQRRNAA